MPTLLLSPRLSPDSIIVGQTATQQDWIVHRLDNHWQAGGLEKNDPVAIYGEPLFVQYVAEQLSLAPVETPDDWLPSLPDRYTQRSIKIRPIGELVEADFPTFIKSPNEKSFKAQVYPSLADFPAKAYLPPETLV